MSSKFRLKLLQKIAQAAEPTTNNETTGPTTVSGSPTPCSVISYFPSVNLAWGSNNLIYIQEIVDVLNESIYVLSQGQLDFNKLRVQYFNVDTSKYPDRILTNIIKFSQMVYNVMLTERSKNFSVQLSPEVKKNKVNQLSASLTTSGIPDSIINQFLSTKIGGNLKSLLVNQLSNIR